MCACAFCTFFTLVCQVYCSHLMHLVHFNVFSVFSVFSALCSGFIWTGCGMCLKKHALALSCVQRMLSSRFTFGSRIAKHRGTTKVFLKAHAAPCPFLSEQIQQNDSVKILPVTSQQLILFCCGVFLLYVYCIFRNMSYVN